MTALAVETTFRVEAGEPVSMASTELVLPAPTTGHLAIRPDQTDLTPAQKAALVGIGLDPDDPVALPHIQVFMHSCQAAGLDPFRRQAYLIKRGKGADAKWTHQTGIDGFRLMGQRTGRFRRRLPLGWIGPEDDPASWVYDPEDDITKPRWLSVWTRREPPVAARSIIEHYADDRSLVRTESVVRWVDLAPYLPVWEGPSGSRAKKRGPDGKFVLELAEMWAKMGPQQLAKCAEAANYRAAFAREIGGFYAPEEFHRDDAEELAAERNEAIARRRAAYSAARTGSAPLVVDAQPAAASSAPRSVDGIDPVTGQLVDATPEPPIKAEDLPGRATRAEVIAELSARAKLYGKDDVAGYLGRTLQAIADEKAASAEPGTEITVTVDDVPDDVLLAKLRDGQDYTAQKLRDLGRHQDAEHVAGSGWLTDASGATS